jgi:hypothetical protein
MMHFLGHPPFDFTWRAPEARGPAYYQLLGSLVDSPGHGSTPIASVEDGVARVMALVRRADLAAFVARTGEGPFSHADGTAVAGYRLHAGPLTRGVQIMLCHIYHSK